MKKLLAIVMCISFIGFYSCDVDQTEEGEMPEVDVDVEEGEMPEYDVDWANVNVSTTTRMVEVPKVVVVMEKEEVEVPVIDVNMPDDSLEMEERTLMVEAEVSGESHELDIIEVYATNNRLYVISRLEGTGQTLGEETMRVSDQLVLNAPEDVDIRHYIVGKKPTGEYNNQYTYINNRGEISEKLANGKVIYDNA